VPRILEIEAFFYFQASRLFLFLFLNKTLLFQGKMVGAWSFLIIQRVVEAVVAVAVVVDVGVVGVTT
jgi:hypothetical protein